MLYKALGYYPVLVHPTPHDPEKKKFGKSLIPLRANRNAVKRSSKQETN